MQKIVFFYPFRYGLPAVDNESKRHQ